MNAREKTENEYIEAKSLSHEPIQEHQDEKVRMIYERYHAGKTIILDDLKYLWVKDPEGCKRLTISIIEAKSKQSKGEESEPKEEVKNLLGIAAFTQKTEEISNQPNSIDVTVGSNELPIPQVNVQDIMSSMKLVLENMNNNDLMEMWKHINEALVIEKIGDKMRFWNDTIDDKIMMYSNEVEKRFNMLA